MKIIIALMCFLTIENSYATKCWNIPVPNIEELLKKYKDKTVKVKNPVFYFSEADIQKDKYLSEERFWYLSSVVNENIYEAKKDMESNKKISSRVHFVENFKVISWSSLKTIPKGSETRPGKRNDLSSEHVNLVINGSKKTITPLEDFFEEFTETNVTGIKCGQGDVTPNRADEEKVKNILKQVYEHKRERKPYKTSFCTQEDPIYFSKKLTNSLSLFDLNKEVSFLPYQKSNDESASYLKYCFPMSFKTTEAFLTFQYFFPIVTGGANNEQ